MPKLTPATPTTQPTAPTNYRAYRPIKFALAADLIGQFHYARTMPTCLKLVYGDVDGSNVLACAVFSFPTGRYSLDVWELTRLVRADDYDRPLTKLLSKAIGHIRHYKFTDLLISYADSEEDHHGGIYQACSWVYSGIRGERLVGFNIDGVFTPARSCNDYYGTSSEIELPKVLQGKKVEAHYDTGKHLYWKALTKAGMQKAISYGFESLPYPKPALNGSGERQSATRKGVIVMPELEEIKRTPTRFGGNMTQASKRV